MKTKESWILGFDREDGKDSREDGIRRQFSVV